MPEKGKQLNVGPVSPFSEPAEPNRERERFRWTINTVINPEESVLNGLNNRKWKDKFARPGHVSGMGNLDSPLQQEHPSLVLLPFAPEIMGSGVGLGILKTLGGYAGAYVNGKMGRLAGNAVDNAFKTHIFEPAFEIAGDFIGFGKGYNTFNKLGTNGVFRLASRTGKSVPDWFMRPELRTTVEKNNSRLIFAEDQTPKYNTVQITNGNRTVYRAPKVYQGLYPRQAVASDFGGVENIEFGNFGYNGQKPNLGLRKLKTEQRSKQLLDSLAEEEKRNASALKWTEKNWNDLDYNIQYWLQVNHGNEWNPKLIIPREQVLKPLK